MQRQPSKPSIPNPRRVTFSTAGGAPHVGWIVRLSVVGVDIQTLEPPAAGETLEMLLELREGEPMRCAARVQWTKVDAFGAQFTLLGARETHAIVEAMRAA
jgi:hypothetical protein